MDVKSIKLKQEILKQNDSIISFAQKVGISSKTIECAINDGLEGISYGNVVRMCNALHIDPVSFSYVKDDSDVPVFSRNNNSEKIEFCASMMCADFGCFEREIRDLEDAGIDAFHIDIMDGRYVPNFAMSLNDVIYISRNTSLPIDLHLMIEHPSTHIDIFINNLRKGDTIYIHPEAEYHPSTTLQKIIDAGMIPGIAINPGTSVETVMEMLRIVDKVLVMSVNPGNAGQMYLPYVGEKIERLLAIKDAYGFELYWDGACGEDKIRKYAPKGIKGFVLGTTVLFRQPLSYCDSMANIRSWI